jgi:hypothetical protein
MHHNKFDSLELRHSMRFALDLVTAHRIAKCLTLNLERMTAMRETLEVRLTLALAELDIGSMPSTWSWPKVAETLSVEIALQIIREQKNEPQDPSYRSG